MDFQIHFSLTSSSVMKL